MASIISSGIGSGLNIQSLVAQLVQAERAPTENRLASREALAQARISGFGGLKSALETFQTSLAKLQEASLYAAPEVEASSGFVATSENGNVFTATADATAVAGSYTVEVVSTLSNSVFASAGLDTDEFFNGDPDFDGINDKLTIKLGNTADEDPATDALNGSLQTEKLKDYDTIEDLAADINTKAAAANPALNITASVVTDSTGKRLVVTANDSGTDYNITIVSDGTDTTAAKLTSANDNSDVISTGQDAVIKVDGFTYSSQTSNTFLNDGSFDEFPTGVTIEAVEAEIGVVYDLTIATEEESENTATEDGVSKAVEDFVAAYNTLRTTLNDLTAYDAEANTQGLLNGDSTVRSIAASLRNVIGDSVSGISGGIDTLAEIGVTTNVDDGTLEVDSEALSAALEGNLDGFETLFSGADGFATRLDSFINPYVQSAGLIDNRTDGFQSQIDRIADQREALNRRIIGIEERYLRQFTALDTLLGELQNSSSFLTSQLANLPGAVPINKN